VAETGHLNGHQRDTLAQIFRHPTSHNVEWHDVVSLLNAVGTVKETSKGHIEAVVDGRVEVFDARGHKEIDADQVALLRRLLRTTGYGPDDGSA
jgi:hypothetical protein